MLSGLWSITGTALVYREYIFFGLGLAYLSAAIFNRKATAVNNLQSLEVSWPLPSPTSSSSSIRICIFFFVLPACQKTVLLLFRKHDAYLKAQLSHPHTSAKKKSVCLGCVGSGYMVLLNPQNQLHQSCIAAHLLIEFCCVVCPLLVP